MKKYKISIIEDNLNMRKSIVELLDSVEDFEVYCEYGDVEKAEEEFVISSSDIVLLDISLPNKNGLTIIPWLREKNPNILIIMLTIHYDDEYIFEALKIGAIGYLVKNTGIENLIKFIYDAIKGGSPMSPKISRRIVEFYRNEKKKKDGINETLTEKESKILSLLGKGFSYKAVGEELFISRHTVNYHLRKIYEKLQVKNKAEAVSKFLNGDTE